MSLLEDAFIARIKLTSLLPANVMERLRGQFRHFGNAEDVEKALGPLLLS